MTDIVQAHKQVVTKAWSDPVFKAALIADPKAAIASLGITLPTKFDTKTIVVIEGTERPEAAEDQFFLMIPPAPQQAGELSDDDLDGVAGGFVTTTGDGPGSLEWDEQQQDMENCV